MTKLTLKITLFVALAFGATAGAAAPAHAGAPGEATLLKKTNDARAAYGRVPLRLNSGLSDLARAHSRKMASAGKIFHTADLGRTLRAYRWSVAGENVGRAPTIDSMQRAFMASRSHRANILYRSYRSVGIGVVWDDGVVYATLMFIG